MASGVTPRRRRRAIPLNSSRKYRTMSGMTLRRSRRGGRTNVTAPAMEVRQKTSFGNWLKGQLRNIAPFLTLACLVIFFSFASPSFLTFDNLQNVLTGISIAGIIAVGLTFVILCAEIDLSVAAVANATGIVVAFFTAQPDYVNIANLPLPGWAAIIAAQPGSGRLAMLT